jgi:thiamine-phosphate pyrophosphorylase
MSEKSLMPPIDYTLYLVTDRALMSAPTLEQAVAEAIRGGCTVIQLREKALASLEFYKMAVNIKRITDAYRIPLIVNDRVDIALAVDAAGVHIGQSDLPASVARRLIGPQKILGVSASNMEEAVKAERDGADYLGVGAMWATGTKNDAKLVSMAELRQIRESVTIPLVAIGGINETTVPRFKGVGIDGISVVSAVIASADIAVAAGRLKTLFLKTRDSFDNPALHLIR